MSSEGWILSRNLDKHVNWLLDQLESRRAEVQRLLDSGVDADIFCYSIGQGPEAPELLKATVARATALSIAIDFDHYELEHDE